LDLDNSGIPMANVVALLDEKLRFSEETDLKGNTELFLPLGIYKLKVLAEGFIESQIENLNVSDFNNRKLDIAMIIR
jgi:hypothetical protein